MYSLNFSAVSNSLPCICLVSFKMLCFSRQLFQLPYQHEVDMDKVWIRAVVHPNTQSSFSSKKIQPPYFKNSMKTLQYYTDL